jgi:hypothetical protein
MTEIAHMRGLLGEMGRLSAGHSVDRVEAPTKLEGFGSNARAAYNKGFGVMTSGVVADKCAALLAVCGERLEEGLQSWYSTDPRVGLTRKVQRLEKALRKAEEEEANAWTWSGKREAGQIKALRLVVWVNRGMSTNMSQLAGRLCDSGGDRWSVAAQLQTMTDEALALALGAFLGAFQQYEKGHESEFAHGFDEKQFYALIKKCADAMLTTQDRYIEEYLESKWKREWVAKTMYADDLSALIRGDILTWLTEAKQVMPDKWYLTELFEPLWTHVQTFCARGLE